MGQIISYQLRYSKRGRKCGLCGNDIPKDEKLFEETIWVPKVPFPTKTNICLECAKRFTNEAFIKFIADLKDALIKLWRQRNEQ